MRKVSAEEIEKLYRFTRQHYVEYFDVQTELVDHLANAIEAEWKKDPEQDFGEVLQREFKKFGVYGFSDVLEKRQRAMEKKYYKLIWQETKSILKKTKIILPVVFLFLSIYFLLRMEIGLTILLVAVFFSVAAVLCYIGNQNYKLKKRMKEGKKVYLLETIIMNAGGLFFLLWLPFQFIHFYDAAPHFYGQLLISFFVTILALMSYIGFFVLPKKKDEILKKAHPEIKYIG